MPPLAVHITEDCEALARPVPHYPVVAGKTDARVAYNGEYDRLDEANRRLEDTAGCQKLQREEFGKAK